MAATATKKSELTLTIENAPAGKGDTVKFDTVVAWCKENGQTQWLKDYAEGKDKIIFSSLRKEFYKKFFPARASQNEKKPSMISVIKGL